MKTKLLNLVILLLPLWAIGQSCGSLMTPVSIEARVSESTKIIEGEVLSSESYWDSNQQNIFTVHTITVYKKISGNNAVMVKVVTDGGQVGNAIQITSSAANLEPGLTGTFFLKPFTGNLSVSGPLYEMVAAAQGLIKYDKYSEEASDVFFNYQSVEDELYPQLEVASGSNFEIIQERPVTINANRAFMATPTISNFSPTSVSAGTQTVLTINGSNFGTTMGEVSFANSNTGGTSYVSAIDSQIVSWSNTQIQVEVPYLAGTGSIRVTNSTSETGTSSANLSVTFNHIGVESGGTHFPSTLQDDNGSGGFTFQYHTDFDTSSAKSYFEEAFSLWNCESDINFSFVGTTTTDASVDDGINIVRFDNGSELETGVLGQVVTRFLGTCAVTGRAIVDELDITWNDSTNWYYGDGTPSGTQYDFKSVALHELGHAHQLGHVIDTNVIMHYNIGPGVSKYSLDQNDIDGATYVMGLFTESPGCSITPMSAQINCCDAVVFNTQPQDTEVGQGSAAQFTVDASNADSYQWFESADGINWAPIFDNATYSGTLSNTLTIASVPASYDGYYYRVLVANACNEAEMSDNGILTVLGYTAIPDANFEAALEALGYDDISGDGQVPTSMIEGVTSLNVSGEGISDLTGIEDFTVLDNLDCGDNNLTSLDVSNNLMLETIKANRNSITAIDLSNNALLQTLNVAENDLSSLNTTANTALESIRAFSNYNLSGIDVTQNPLLQLLFIAQTNVSSIDLSNNADLDFLGLQFTPITEIDISNNLLLDTFYIESTGIISLDLSANTALSKFEAQDGALEYLDLRNGNNALITSFSLINNPNLNCVLVDDATYSTTNWTDVDTGLVFSDTYCVYTAIPDTNFEAALEALGYDDISGDGQVPTALIEGVTNLDVSNQNISDLTGIEDFTALTVLDFNDNSVMTVDISNLTALVTLRCQYNNLSSLDVSANTALKNLFCRNNVLTALDTSNNPLLDALWCHFNNITALDLSNNTVLRAFSCRTNALTALDLSANAALENLYAQENSIVSMDLSNNPVLNIVTFANNALTDFNIQNGNNAGITTINLSGNTDLDCVLVDDATYSTTNWTNIEPTTVFNDVACIAYTAIPDANFEAVLEVLGYDDISGDGQVPTANIENVTSLDVQNETISDLTGIEDFTALTFLDARDNSLSAIDLSGNLALEQLWVSRNSLTSLDFSNNLVMEIILAGTNALTSLNVSACPNLTRLIVSNNNLESLDVSNNSNLEDLRTQQNALTALDVSSNVLLEELNVSDNALTALDLSQNLALGDLNVSGNDLTTLDIRNGNNSVITNSDIDTTNNPNLTCINVDAAAYSTTNWTNIDAHTNFSETDYCAYTAIPDANFEARLEAEGYDDISGDGQVPTALIEVVTSLDLYNRNISDLTGIEDFTALVTLSAGDNTIASIDLSSNLLLETLSLLDNNLTSLDCSNNTALESLWVNKNVLTSLNITGCSNLVDLRVHDNTLTNLDLSTNVNLETLRIERNTLVALDVSNNALLSKLELDDNQLTTLDVSNNVLLEELDCSDNLITNLDLRQNVALSLVRVNANNLSNLDVRNGNNMAISTFWAQSNPNLTCIGVDDVDYSASNWTNIDNGVSFSTTNYCGAYTTIPDSVFENTLYVLGYDDILGDNQVPTENIEMVTDLSNLDGSITDLTGLQDFTALTSLSVRGTQITSLDVSYNTLLQTLDCGGLDLTVLDVSVNTALQSLTADGNMLSTLDLSNNTELIILDISDNSLTSIDLSTNTKLEDINVSANAISTLDVSNNPELLYLSCYENGMTSLDISTNSELINLICYSNQLSTLDLDNKAYLTNLSVSNNTLSSLNVSNSPNLSQLFCNNNAIAEIDLKNNPVLSFFNANDNALTSLDVRSGGNTSLFFFTVLNNPNLPCISVDDINFSNTNWPNIDSGTVFSESDCGYTAIPDPDFESVLDALGYDDISGDGQVPTVLIEGVTTLDVSNSAIADLTGIEDFRALRTLNCSENALGTINLSNNLLLETLHANVCALTTLDVSANTALSYLSADSNTLTAIDLSNNTALVNLILYGNQLGALDLSNNTNITSIDLFQNQLIALDFNNNALLEEAYVDNNSIESLDFTNNPLLEALTCNNNALTSLDLRNGANTNLNNSDINISNNPNLYCVLVDNSTYSENTWNNVDTGVSFSETYCRYTVIPDPNFELALEALGLDDISGDGQVPTALIEVVTNLNVASTDIIDMTGIQDFNALLTLNCSQNEIEVLDLSSNTLLENLVCNNNQIASLELSALPALTSLNAASNILTFLNLQNGNYLNFIALNTVGNTNLACILVDDAAYAIANWSYTIDSGTNLSDTYCGYTAIPDSNFETALAALGYDDIADDGKVPTELIEVVTTLNVSSKAIADLTGIQDFSALSILNVSDNPLNTLDLSTLTALTYLDAKECALTSIDLSTNTLLEYLDIDESDVLSLDISNNLLLEELHIGNNYMSTITFGLNTNLTTLIADANTFTDLDLRALTALEEINLVNNDLINLDLRNANNTNITTFNALNNDLTCIIVDDEDYATANWTNIDATTSFNDTDCGYTRIPDSAFEAALDTLGYDDISNDNQVPTSWIEVIINLDLTDSSINNLTGIKDFTSLEMLTVNGNNIGNLDLNGHPSIQELYAINSVASSLDIGNTPQLRIVDCSANNSMTTINLVGANALEELYAYNTQSLYEIDLSANTSIKILSVYQSNIETLHLNGASNLEELYAYRTDITSLDLSTNTALKKVECYEGLLESLNINGAIALEELIVHRTGLSNLDVSTNSALIKVECYESALQTLNLNGAVALEELIVHRTNLTSLDVSTNSALKKVECYESGLETINLNGATALEELYVYGTTLLSLDLSTNVALKRLECYQTGTLNTINLNGADALEEAYLYWNDLESVDASANSALINLQVYGNPLTSGINLNGLTALTELNCGVSELSSLDVSSNTNLTLLRADNTKITSLDFSTNTMLEEVRLQLGELTSLNLKNGNNTNITFIDVRWHENLSCILVDDADYSTTNWTNVDAQTSFNNTSCDYVILDLDVFLQGAALNPYVGEETLMRDDLRANGFISANSPYGDGASIGETVGYDDNGANSMVDWIWVELRDRFDPTLVVAGQSAILQRDGDVVDTSDNLVTPLTFNVPEDDYYVVVKHRSHLGIMTLGSIPLSNVSSTFNFTDANNQLTYGDNAQTTFGMPDGIVAMWAGNVNGDSTVKYQGGSNDTTSIKDEVLNDTGNSSSSNLYTFMDYNNGDVDMDGVVQYQGSGNDSNVIKDIILSHTDNQTSPSNLFIITEQLPDNSELRTLNTIFNLSLIIN